MSGYERMEKIEELLEKIRTFTTAELCDGAGLYHSMDYRIKPQISRKRIAGLAVTVDVPSGEGGIISDAISLLHKDNILVIAGKGNCDCSYWGDHRSICAKLLGAEGVIVDGAFRDLEGCEEADFPIFAKGLTCGTAAKSGIGAVNVPVSCGGVTVNPGDIVVADVNGVVVFAVEDAESIMDRAVKKREAQNGTLEEMKRSGKVLTKIIK